MSEHDTNQTLVFVLPDADSSESAEAFVRDLEKHLSNDPLAQALIDCSHVNQLSLSQMNCIDRVCQLFNGDRVRLLIGPGQLITYGDLESISSGLLDTSQEDKPLEENSDCSREQLYSAVGDYKDEFHPAMPAMQEACVKLDRFLLKSRCNPRTHYVIRSIFYEFVSNVCLHGGMSNHEKITFAMSFEDRVVSMTFVDSGIQFNLAGQPNGPLSNFGDEDRLSFGINMMKTLAIGIEYTRSGDSKNITTIRCERYEK